MFDGILFDLDGTLWDATGSMEQIWAEFLSRHPEIRRPPVTRAEIMGNMGLLLPDICTRMLPNLPLAEGMALLDEFCAQEEAYLAQWGSALFPGTAETLAVLAARYQLFIVSNCQDGYIGSFYQGNGLGRFFSGEECAGRTGKPKAENIKLVVERYHLKNPVYIGDTVLDYTSATEAGVPFLHAAYGFGQVDCPHAAQQFVDIPAALEAMSPP